MRFNRQLLIIALLGCCFLGALPAFSQDRNDDDQTPFEKISLEDALKAFEAEATLPGAEGLSKTPRLPLHLWVNQIHMGVDNAYSPERIRYLVLKLTILNHAEEDLTIQPKEATLAGWGDTYHLGETPEEFDLMPIKVGRDVYSMNELETPAEVTVPAKQGIACWMVFTDLDRANNIESLVLELPLPDGKTIKHDLRREQRARLGLQTEQLGPLGTVGLISLSGELNAINAQDLVDQFKKFQLDGTKRCLVQWMDTAPPTVDDLVDWLLHRAAGDTNNELYRQFPYFDDFKFLALSRLPKLNLQDGFDDEFEKYLFPKTQEAFLAAVADLYEVIDPSFLTREIRLGHRFSQRAALAALEQRHEQFATDELFPLLCQLYDTSDEETRRYVLLAIGQQSAPEAIPMLVNIAMRERDSDAEGAFLSLLRSSRSDAVPAIHKLISDESVNIPPQKQIELLADNFRRLWTPYLTSSLKSDDATVRAAALKAFVRVGHPELGELLAMALKDSSEAVRTTAFEALTRRPDTRSEEIAGEYALSLLKQGKLSESVFSMITRTRNPQAAPVIMELIDKKPSARIQLISMLEQVGDDRSVRALLKDLKKFSPEETVLIFELVNTFDLPEKTEIGKEAIHSESKEVRQAGIAMLMEQTSDESAEAIASLLTNSDDSQVTQVCFALGRIGTRRAEELLKEYREVALAAGSYEGLLAAKNGMSMWMRHSPGWNAIDSADYHSRVENYENALIYYDLACEMDPDLSIAYSGKGNTLLRMKRYEEAGKAFQQAYDLDSFDGQAITGVGIVRAMQGEVEEAVQLTVSSANKFPKDNIFAYNTACVYGRAIEYLRTVENQDSVAELIHEYEVKAIECLENSIEYGFDEFDLMRTDPDINSLRTLPAFQELLKN